MRYPNYQYNPRANQILTMLEEKPASRFTDLMQGSGLKNGVVSHYLKMMKKTGLIRTRRMKNQEWYFASTFDESRDFLFIHLRKETSRKILSFLLDRESATFSEILVDIKKSPSTLSTTLSNLTKDNLVTIEPGLVKKYRLSNKESTGKALEQVNLKTFDIMKDRFADTFSYL
ncbi:MAG: ArsR family transcriptional regulator [Candidatus Nitrosotenuis sp.]|nr:MAG: ArsR family transcriptional regulator [Candidatus Nitrosotenuis sp.]